MKILPVLALLFITIVLLHAQEASSGTNSSMPELPPGPLMQQRAPDFSQWTIKITPSGNSTAPTTPAGSTGNKPKVYFGSMFTLTKTGKIMLRQTQDDKGQTWSTWCFGDAQITPWPDGKNLLLISHPPELHRMKILYYEDYATSDFPGFAWISPSNYKGIKTMEGKQCLVFSDRIQLYTQDDKPFDSTAYIDLKTHYPVCLIDEEGTQTYLFQPPPQTELVLPQVVQKQIDDRERSLKLYTRHF